MSKNPPMLMLAGVLNKTQGDEKLVLERLSAWTEADQKIVIVFENAELLDNERLEFLVQMARCYKCLRFVLKSTNKSDDAAFNNCRIVSIGALDSKKTLKYAKSKLSNRGINFENIAGIDEVVLYVETGGLPSKINQYIAGLNTPVKITPTAEKKQNQKIFIFSYWSVYSSWNRVYFNNRQRELH
jgi:DamX protein